MLFALLLTTIVGTADDPKPQPTHQWTELKFQDGAALLGFSPDGKLVASGGGGDIRLWTVPDGKEVLRLPLPDAKLVFGAFTANGKTFVSVSQTDPKLRVWSLATGKEVKSFDLPGAKELEWVIGFSPGAAHLAVKVKDGIALVDTATGKLTHTFAGAGPTERSFRQAGGAFSPDGKRFAAGAGMGRLAVWDVTTGKQLAISEETKRGKFAGAFHFIQFSPDGRWVVVGNGGIVGQPIEIWDAETCELLAEPLKINGYTTAAAWTPDGTAVATVDYEGVVATDAATGKTVHQFEPGGPNTPKLWGQPVGPTPDGKYMVFVSLKMAEKGGQASVWTLSLCELPAPKKLARPRGELTPAELDALWADALGENKLRRAQGAAELRAAPDAAVPYLTKKVPVAGRVEAADADLRAELRAIELLVRIGSPAAVKHLEAVAAGVPEARVTKAAMATLEKLRKE